MFSNWVQLEKKILLDVFFFLIMGLFWPPLLLIPSRTFQFRVMQLFLLGNERKRAIGVSDRNALWKGNTVTRKSWLVRECIRHPNYSSYKTLPISSVMVSGGLLVNEPKTSPMYCNFLSKSVVLERYTGKCCYGIPNSIKTINAKVFWLVAVKTGGCQSLDLTLRMISVAVIDLYLQLPFLYSMLYTVKVCWPLWSFHQFSVCIQ